MSLQLNGSESGGSALPDRIQFEVVNYCIADPAYIKIHSRTGLGSF